VRLRISEGADKEKAKSDGATPLLIACAKGHVEVVRLLISEGANLAADGSRAHPLGPGPAACSVFHGGAGGLCWAGCGLGGSNLAPGPPLGSVAGGPDRHRGWLPRPSSVPAAGTRRSSGRYHQGRWQLR
jgi:hypothetical protein